MTVKNPSIKLNQTEATLAVNETVKLTATTAPKSAASSVAYTTSDEKVATVANDGTVTAVGAGEATITATETCGTKKPTASVKITVKTAVLKSASQKKYNQVAAVFSGDTSKIDKKNVVIANKDTKVVVPIDSISVDSNDKSIVYINTFSSMTDGKVYTVTFDGTNVEFTATDGTVADVAVSKTKVTKKVPTEVKAQLVDKNGVVVEEYAYNNTPGKVDYVLLPGKGYVDSNKKLVLQNVGDTASAEITYHTFKYDEKTNEEIGKINKKFTIEAVEDASTVSNFNYTLDKDATNVNWKGGNVTVNNKIAVNDNANAFFYFKDSDGSDVTKNYSVESSDQHILLLAKTELKANAANGGSLAVSVKGVKDGDAFINVLNSDGKVVKSLPVVVEKARELKSLRFGKYEFTASNTAADSLHEDSTSLKGYDQYDKEVTLSAPTAKIVSAPNGAVTYVKNYALTSSDFDYTNGVITFKNVAAYTVKGDYQIEVTAASTLDPNKKVSRTVKLTVVDTTNATLSYAVDISDTEADLAVDTSKTIANAGAVKKDLTISAVAMKNGAKVAVVTGTAITVKKPDGTTLATSHAGYTDTAATDGKLTLNLVSATDNNATVTKNFVSWEMGTYTVTIDGDPATNFTTMNSAFTLKDTQAPATVAISTNEPGVTASANNTNADAATDAKAVLVATVNGKAVAEFYYEGVKQTITTTELTGITANSDVKKNGKALYIGTVDIIVTTTGGLKITVPVTVNETFTLK